MIITEDLVRDRAEYMGLELRRAGGVCQMLADLMNRSQFLQMTNDPEKANMFVDIILCSVMAEETVAFLWKGKIH